MRSLILIVMLCAVSGCGTTEQNADVPRGVYAGIDDRTVQTNSRQVTITETGPSITDGGKYVRGYSCQNKLWQAAPSQENARTLMEKKAVELGLNAIHSVKIEKDPTAVAKNCWSGISAVGIAYNLPLPKS